MKFTKFLDVMRRDCTCDRCNGFLAIDSDYIKNHPLYRGNELYISFTALMKIYFNQKNVDYRTIFDDYYYKTILPFVEKERLELLTVVTKQTSTPRNRI